jgi:dolichyl-diphosphooligosaccharide--protein glycosyltransferase
MKGVNEKGKDSTRERPTKRNRKKEKETSENVVPKKPKAKKTEVLPMEASTIAIGLILVLASFYVVSEH